MNENKIFIYKITNTINDIIYIGQATNIHERFLAHKKMARAIKKGDKKSSNCLYEDMNLYGYDKFDIQIIDTCAERHKYIIEKYWTDTYAVESKVYNVNSGSSMAEQQKEQLRSVNRQKDSVFQTQSFLDKMSTVTSGENNGMFGKKGDKAPNGRHVFMYDMEWNLLREFNSVRGALDYLGIVGHTELVKACKSKTEYRGYYWTKQWKKC
jgi:group I intron endonuclease